MKTIKLTRLAFAIAGLSMLVSCSSDSTTSPTPLPPIGGYSTSDEVSAANLISKWSFENNITDIKTNNTGVGTNVAYTAGAKGNAWDGSSSQARYAIYNGATAIGALNSFTFAFWMNTANTVPDTGTPEQGKGAQGIFSLVKPTEFWGAINIFLENQNTEFPNKLRVKLLVENKRSGVTWQSQSPVVNIDDKLNTWIHVAFTYNASSSKMSVYVDGQSAGSIDGAYSPEGGYAGSYTVFGNDPGGLTNPNNAPLWGDLDFGGSYSQIVLGSHQFTTTPSLTSAHGSEPWATNFVGKLDEFRIYKSALSGSDVGALYELEKAGR